MSVYLGIDIGTSGTKTLAIRENGRIIAGATFEYPLSSPRPGWSEQDPHDWWQASIKSVRKVLRDGRIKPATVAGIGLSGQMHGATLLDGADRPLRPAILWNDCRSVEACFELEAAVPEARAITGNMAMPGFTRGTSACAFLPGMAFSQNAPNTGDQPRA